jgi:hypothetical protein
MQRLSQGSTATLASLAPFPALLCDTPSINRDRPVFGTEHPHGIRFYVKSAVY